MVVIYKVEINLRNLQYFVYATSIGLHIMLMPTFVSDNAWILGSNLCKLDRIYLKSRVYLKPEWGIWNFVILQSE